MKTPYSAFHELVPSNSLNLHGLLAVLNYSFNYMTRWMSSRTIIIIIIIIVDSYRNKLNVTATGISHAASDFTAADAGAVSHSYIWCCQVIMLF